MPPRERKPALAALAALLILVGALGATLLVMRAGDRVEAIKITADVPQGQQIPEDAMERVMVAEESSVDYVQWNQRGQIASLYAETDIVEGSLLVGQMLSEERGIPEGESIVGATLQPGQYPPGLEAGDHVSVIWIGDPGDASDSGDPDDTSVEESGTSTESILVESARVTEIHGEEEPDGNSAVSLRLRVDADDAPAVTRASSEGNLAVVIVNGDNGDGASE